jgi:glycosyltransferase involved in cell wall biosynthesis
MAPSSLQPHIYINGRFLTQRMTGVQRYAHETLKAIDAVLSCDSTAQWTLLAPKGTYLKEKWNHIEFRTIGSFSGHAWEQLDLPFHASDGWLLTLSGAPSIFHPRHLFSIPDTAIYDMPNGYSFLYRLYYRMLWGICANHAKAIFTFTEFSRNRLAATFPGVSERIHVTSCGADHSSLAVENRSDESLDDKDADGRPYILAVSSLATNKNFEIILKLSEILDDVNLRIVVAGNSNQKVFGNSEIISSRIEWLGYVTDDKLRRLYRHAACFVFPSLYEGFGLPPIEAMRQGCPVIASTAASIPEVCGDAALYFNPDSVDELKSQIIRVLHDPRLSHELQIKGERQAMKYTWGRVAQTILKTIESLPKERHAA